MSLGDLCQQALSPGKEETDKQQQGAAPDQEATKPASSPPSASKPKRAEVKKETILPRSVSGAMVCNTMLTPTLHTEIPKPRPIMPASASGSQVVSAKASIDTMLIATPATMADTTACTALRVA